MPKYIIEREVPGAGKMTLPQLRALAEKSCAVLSEMGPRIQWQESYVTNDKLYCVYIAASEEAVREHARRGGFPANRVEEIKAIIDPATSEPA